MQFHLGTSYITSAGCFLLLNLKKFFNLQESGDDDDTPNGDVSGGKDLVSDSDLSNTIRDPVEDRLTLAEKNERLQNQLKVSCC